MYSISKAPLKYFTRSNMYKASNVSFNPVTKEAFSYDWWKFTKMIDGKLVFNNYTYSSTTNRHQSKVRSLLSTLRVKIKYTIEAPKGLDNLPVALEHHRSQLQISRNKAIYARKEHTRSTYEERVRYHLGCILLLNEWIIKGC